MSMVEAILLTTATLPNWSEIKKWASPAVVRLSCVRITTQLEELLMSKVKTAPQFTDDERAAMRERARELKAAENAAEAEKELLAKIAEMPASDRQLAERIHELATTTVPELAPKTYYGMPAYAIDGKVVFWFKAADKFKTRYATVGFSDRAALDDGEIWPTEYAVTKLTSGGEARIRELIKKSVG